MFGVGTIVFALFAMVFATAALFAAAQARTRSDQAKEQVATMRSQGAIGNWIRVTEQEILNRRILHASRAGRCQTRGREPWQHDA